MVARPGKLHTNDSQDKMWAGANLGLDCAKRSRPKLTEMAMDHVYGVLYDYGVTKTRHNTQQPPPVPSSRLGSAASSSEDHTLLAKSGAVVLSSAASVEAAAKAAPAVAAAKTLPQRRGVQLVPNREPWTKPDGWVEPYPEAGRNPRMKSAASSKQRTTTSRPLSGVRNGDSTALANTSTASTL